MHINIISKTLAMLYLVICFFMGITAAVAYYFGEYTSMMSFIVTIIILAAISVLTLIIVGKTTGATLVSRDGFILVALSWFTASLAGAMPYYLSGEIPLFADAFFETVSGFSTTGASILTDIEGVDKSLLFWRSLTHWLGGMGIVVLAVAILPLLGVGGMQLIKAEAPGPTMDKITPRIAETAKYLWYIYLLYTVVQTLLLKLGGMSFYDALTHTFGTVATGGFSTMNASVKAFDSAYIDAVITIFMVLAGINFSLHFRLLTGNFKGVFADTELRWYLAFFAGATLLITTSLAQQNGDTFLTSLRYASFQAASFLTTTGYATADYETWPYLAQFTLFTLMLIGGSSGSTGGGLKVIRIVTLLKQGLNEMKYLVHPRGIFTLKISGHSVKKDIVYAISGFFFLYMLLVVIVALVVSTSGSNLITSLTTALATVGNIGPGFGLIGPTENYAHFPQYVKWVLSFAMIVGRLEIYTVLVLFTPLFWRK